MSSTRRFNFVSPGVFLDEIDNSGRPDVPLGDGPTIITRAERGPALRPVRVDSMSDYIEMFGNPIPGGQGGDIWRDGNKTAPAYGTYAIQAWFKHENAAPVNVVRLLGASHEDATTAGVAGWETKDSSGNANGIGTGQDAGGAYGLFVIDSGSSEAQALTGALAAVFYVTEGSIELSGTLRGTTTAVTGNAIMVGALGTNQEFKAIIKNSSGTTVETTTFNFNRNSQRYIRRVFNTNPTLTNSTITPSADLKNYWLGQTYERHLSTYINSSSAGANYGVMLGLQGDTADKGGADFRMTSRPAQTGWFISQDVQVVSGASNDYTPEAMTKLFRFHGLTNGEWEHKNLKVSIEDIKASTNSAVSEYGTFTVVIRKVEDSDNAIRVVEKFTNCTLDPDAKDGSYLAEKVGDKYVVWDDGERRYREYGNYDNKSKFIRVEVNPTVDAGTSNPVFLPFGVFGPVKHKDVSYLSGSTTMRDATTVTTAFTGSHVRGADEIVHGNVEGSEIINAGPESGPLAFTGSWAFPTLPLRSNATDGNLANPKQAYFGADSVQSSVTRLEESYKDTVMALPVAYSSFAANGTETEYSWVFSLDDVSGSGTQSSVYTSGSRAAGTSLTAVYGTYKKVLDNGFDKFTSPMFGGFDGLDITEKDPFRNSGLSSGTETTNYAFNSVKRAIDSVSDAEEVSMNILSMPGLTNSVLTDHILNVCADRTDCLAIIDLEDGYVPEHENTNSEANRLGDVDTTITSLHDRGISQEVGSYGTALYPWVRYRDTISGGQFWGPPSVSMIGTISYSTSNEELWFAPVGFTRGGLTAGNAGIPVIGIRERLRQNERDKLYAANINPIAKFPSTGIVIWGQKTLQARPNSALNRVNVRLLMNHIKRHISRISATTLFEQNTFATWNRFLSRVEPFLRSIQIKHGLEDVRIVLDESTTTPEMKDRNIMYAKIFLVPTRAIEFIALDFVISDSGAAFAD